MRGKEVKSFEDLEVWQLARQLVVIVYHITDAFPKNETYGLRAQCRDAAVSIPGNIAEGFGRFHYLDKIKFFLNSRGSLNELKSHMLIAGEVGYLTKEALGHVLSLIETVSVKLNNFISVTRRTSSK